MKEFIIDGSKIHDLNSFYDEVNKKLCPEFKKMGRNLDAFEDVLVGGFGTFEMGEQVKIIWTNSTESKQVLGDRAFKTILEIVRDSHHTLELQ